MDEIVNAAVQQIALEGRAGCSVPHLWELLEGCLPLVAVNTLSDGFKQLTWRLLLHKPSAITTQPLGQQAQSTEQSGNWLAGSSTYEDAESQGAVLVASEQLLCSVLGLYDEACSRHNTSEPQRRTLELIGQARWHGAFQSDLAKQLKMPASNFFYICRQLEVRGLITRHPITVPSGKAGGNVFKRTNILHLTRFGQHLRLGANQRFAPLPEAGGGEQTELYTLVDDTEMHRRVVDKLKSVEGHTIAQQDLKEALKIAPGKKGHRAWTHAKTQLVKLGVIEEVTGRLNDVPIMCIKLVKDLAAAQDEEDEDDDEAGGDEILVAETTIDRQIFETVLAAGSAGITSLELWNQLKCNRKALMKRMSELPQRFGLHVSQEQRGKNVVYNYTAPQHLLDQYSTLALPQPVTASQQDSAAHPTQTATPQQAAMQASALASLPTSASSASLQSRPNGSAALPSGVQAASGDQADEQAELGTSNRGGSASTSEVAVAGSVAVAASRTSDSRLQRLIAKVEQDGFMLVAELAQFFMATDAEAQGGSGRPHGRVDRRTSMRVVERAQALGKLTLHAIDLPAVKSKGSNKQHRILVRRDLSLDGSLLEQVQQHIKRTNKLQRQNCHIVRIVKGIEAKGGAVPELDSSVLLLPRTMRPAKGRLRLKIKREKAEAHKLKSETAQHLYNNGFISALMLRTRITHFALCKIVGLGGYQATGFVEPLEQELISTVQVVPQQQQQLPSSTPLFAFSKPSVAPEQPASIGEVQVEHEQDANQLQKDMGPFTFTLRMLWDSLPAEQFLQTVGTSHTSDLLPELLHSNRRIGELSALQQQEVIDPHARHRLMHVLDVLSKMGLLQKVVVAAQAQLLPVGGPGRARWTVCKTALLEEPTKDRGVDRREFSLESQAEMDEYWDRLQAIAMSRPDSQDWFPAKDAPEVLSKTGWYTVRMMPIGKWTELQARVGAENLWQLSYARCRQLATELGLDVHQVVRVVYEKRRQERVQRLASGLPPLQVVKGGPRGPRMLREDQKKRIEATRAKIQAQRAQQQQQHTPPEPALQAAPAAAMLEDEESQSNAEEESDKDEVAAAEEAEEEDEADGFEAGEDEEADEQDMDRLGSESGQQERRRSSFTHKVLWTAQEDQILLDSYFKWRANFGPTRHMQWGLMERGQVRRRQAVRRLSTLRRHEATKPILERIDALAAALWGQHKGTRPHLNKKYVHKRKKPKVRVISSKRLRHLLGGMAAAGEDDGEQEEYSNAEQEKEEEEEADDVEDGGAGAEPDWQENAARLVRQALPASEEANAAAAAIQEAVQCAPKRAASAPLRSLKKPLKAARDARSHEALLRRQQEEREASQASETDMDDTGGRLAAGYGAGRERAPLRQLAAGGGGFRGPALLQHWRDMTSLRATSLQVPGHAQAPSVAVTAAMELMKSLLWAADRGGPACPDSATALTQRFSQDEVKAAFAYLRAFGLINPGNGRRPFHLSEHFTRLLQVYELHPRIFEEAGAAHEQLDAALDLPTQPAGEDHEGASAMPLDKAGEVVLEPEDDLSAGMVAEVVSLMAAGAIQLRPLKVKVEPATAPDESLLGELLGPSTSGPASATLSLRITSAACPAAEDAALEAEGQPPLLQAVLVRGSATLPAKAEMLAAEAISAADVLGTSSPDDRKALLQRALRAVRQAGGDGLCREDLAAGLAETSAPEPAEVLSTTDMAMEPPTASPAGPSPVQAGSAAADTQPAGPTEAAAPVSGEALQRADGCLEVMVRRGLVRRVPAFNHTAYVAAQHSQRYLACPVVLTSPPADLPSPSDASAAATPAVEDMAGSVSLPDQVPGAAPVIGTASDAAPSDASQQVGDSQAEQVLRPWLDHKGRLNEALWRPLVQRTLSIVIRNPGIPEDLLLEQLEAVAPQHGRDLLQLLVAKGSLRVRCMAGVCTSARPPLFFGPPLPAATAARESCFYFPNLASCFGGTAIVVP